LPLTGLFGTGARAYDIAPDGKTFALLRDATTPGGDVRPAAQINITLNWVKELKQPVPVR
jgi:hypothetical protein